VKKYRESQGLETILIYSLLDFGKAKKNKLKV